MVEVIPPIEDLNGAVLIGGCCCCCCCEHFAAVALGGGGGGAGVAELVRHGGVGEEGQAGAAEGGEEGRGDAVVRDVEGAPFAAGASYGVAGGGALGGVEGAEVDDRNGFGVGFGWGVTDGSGLRRLDVLGWDPGETRLGEGLHPRRHDGFVAYYLHWKRTINDGMKLKTGKERISVYGLVLL